MEAKTKIWKAKKLELLLLIDFTKVVLWFLVAAVGWLMASLLTIGIMYEISFMHAPSVIYLIIPAPFALILLYEWLQYIEYVYKESKIKEYIKLFS